MHQLASPAQCRALTALLLLGPETPMLFQGQEFASSSPFFFFADHEAELSSQIFAGRKEFLYQFESLASGQADRYVADPSDEKTFLRSKLDPTERDKHAGWFWLHMDLIKLRKEDAVFGKPKVRSVDGAVLGDKIFLLRFFGEHGEDRLLIVNLGINMHLSAVPEPLYAPPEGCSWNPVWSSEDPRYGGAGLPEIKMEDDCHIPGHATVVFAAKPMEQTHGKTVPKD
jgi:maltooligosyltrehalose trehalohydrolase